MCCKRDVLIIIYRSLLVGGIENYIIQVMRNALKSGKKVIWVCHSNKQYSHVYSDVLEDDRLEIKAINFSGVDIYKFPNIQLSKNENVKILVFDIFRLFQAYKFRKKYKETNIDILYCIPHFTGSTILPEQRFSQRCIRKLVQKRFARIYDEIFRQGNLYFFAPRHFQVIQDTYGINFVSPKDYLVPRLNEREQYDEKSFRNVYKSKTFTIISPGRFEFPHKGYLLGLIKIFGELKPKYPQLKLLIIGDGADKDKVENAVMNLSEEIRKDVEIQSSKSLEELKRIMKTVNLNISVAGCASHGGRIGLVTLPARHYTYDCEVYGFFPDSKHLTTESKPGYPVKQYIERVINMNEDEYINYSKMAYHTFDDGVYCPNFPFNKKTITKFVPSFKDFILVKWTYNIQRLIYLIERLRNRR